MLGVGGAAKKPRDNIVGKGRKRPQMSQQESMDKGIPFESGKRIKDKQMQRYLREESPLTTALSPTLG